MIPLKDDNPRIIAPVITVGLIVANIIIFLYQMSLGPYENRAFIYTMGIIPKNFAGLGVTGFPVYSLFTSMFVHGDILHLAGNMLYLWIFGDNVEGIMGHFRFVIFYILSGLAAALLQILINVKSGIPMIGASGAISGVLGAYMVKFPGARVSVLIFFFYFIRIIKIPALIVLGFWFLIQLTSGLGAIGMGQQGGVAWFAHIGGFLAGIFLVKYLARKSIYYWYE
ncbi:MAG: rhomboid family intramembrane serine protease [Fidelibacterota bacterium]